MLFLIPSFSHLVGMNFQEVLPGQKKEKMKLMIIDLPPNNTPLHNPPPTSTINNPSPSTLTHKTKLPALRTNGLHLRLTGAIPSFHPPYIPLPDLDVQFQARR